MFQSCKKLSRIVICESSPIIEKLKEEYNDKIILLHELPEEDYSEKNELDEKEFTMEDFEKMGSPRNCIIPYGYTEIEKYAFYDIDSFTLPNSFTTIKELQFCGCYLDRITIPSSVIEIDSTALYDCMFLEEINVEGWNFIYEDGVLFNRDKSKIVLALSAVLEGEYSVPKSVVEIMDSAFSDCINLDSIDIPDTVIIIGKDVFNYNTTIYLNETSPLWGQGF